MPVKYQKVWDTMNELEMVTSKICSAREILDCAIEAHEYHKREKVEHLLHAVDEYLQYYLQEFDNKFKDAWQATVGDLRDDDTKSTLECDRNDQSPECQKSWNDFWEVWEENYYPEEVKDDGMRPWGHSDLEYQIANSKKDKVIKWSLPVKIDELTGDCYVEFPDDLLEATYLKEGDQIEWINQGDGSYLMRKVTKPLGE
jgi:hypothetical protein